MIKTFMNAQGNVLADSSAENLTDNHSDRKEVQDAILDSEGYLLMTSLFAAASKASCFTGLRIK